MASGADRVRGRRTGRRLALAAVFGARLSDRGGRLTHLTAKVQRGQIRDVVDATGTVNAVITVQVGSQVSGTIAKLKTFRSHLVSGWRTTSRAMAVKM